MGTTISTSNNTVFIAVQNEAAENNIASITYVEGGNKYALEKVEKEPEPLVKKQQIQDRKSFQEELTLDKVTKGGDIELTLGNAKGIKSISDVSFVTEELTKEKSNEISAEDGLTGEQLREIADDNNSKLSQSSVFVLDKNKLQDELQKEINLKNLVDTRRNSINPDTDFARELFDLRQEQIKERTGSRNPLISEGSLASGDLPPLPSRKLEDRDLDSPTVKRLKQDVIENNNKIEKREREIFKQERLQEIKEYINSKDDIAETDFKASQEKKFDYYERKDWELYKVKESLIEVKEDKKEVYANNAPLGTKNYVEGLLKTYTMLEEKTIDETHFKNNIDDYA